MGTCSPSSAESTHTSNVEGSSHAAGRGHSVSQEHQQASVQQAAPQRSSRSRSHAQQSAKHRFADQVWGHPCCCVHASAFAFPHLTTAEQPAQSCACRL